jgi:effector-binding domain-containing protein
MSDENRIKTLTPQRVMAIRAVTTPEEFGPTLSRLLQEVWAYLGRMEHATVGAPMTCYRSVTAAALEVEAGFPVAEQVAESQRVRATELPAGRAATRLHWGPYAELPESWAALEQWMREQRLAPADQRWEIYWVDPTQTENEAELRTELVWPICE